MTKLEAIIEAIDILVSDPGGDFNEVISKLQEIKEDMESEIPLGD